jgi:hypothetical protein
VLASGVQLRTRSEMRVVAVLGGNENGRSQGFQIEHDDSDGRGPVWPCHNLSIMNFIDLGAAPC